MWSYESYVEEVGFDEKIKAIVRFLLNGYFVFTYFNWF